MCLDVYELSGKYLLRDLEKQCVWYMQSSSNLESTVHWYILCKGKAGCDEVECMLEGKLWSRTLFCWDRDIQI